MIAELRIVDLGVISEATISLHPGLTVVTGETGAGKTMIVTGLGLLLGVRADPRSVRTGAERARVEGRFGALDERARQRLADAGGELDDGELIVARQVTATGRSRAYLGGAQVPATVCAELTEDLLAIHGQSEQARLAAPDRQRELLDAYAGSPLQELLTPYQQAYAARRAAATELAELQAAAQTAAQEIDRLTFGLEELGRVAPQPSEDVALAGEATRLQQADDLRLAAQGALTALAGSDDEAGGALSEVSSARRDLQQGPADVQLAELGTRLADASYLLADVAADLARYLGDLDGEPGRLEQIAGRRAELAGLTRKYGSSVDEVIRWGEDAVARLARLETGEERIEVLQGQIAELERQLERLAADLSRVRADAATTFATVVLDELAALAMPHARLAFDLRPADLGPYGRDRVELLFSANPGSEPGSLAKVASGGELSRVRLAVEVVLAREQEGGTLVFDEVDAGVGGRVAVEIGRRLARLARSAQVVVVTHLAQVAAFADRHYVVVKSDDGQVTTSGVQEVAADHRTAELARMMAGLETTDSALAHAGELLELARAEP